MSIQVILFQGYPTSNEDPVQSEQENWHMQSPQCFTGSHTGFVDQQGFMPPETVARYSNLGDPQAFESQDSSSGVIDPSNDTEHLPARPGARHLPRILPNPTQLAPQSSDGLPFLEHGGYQVFDSREKMIPHKERRHRRLTVEGRLQARQIRDIGACEACRRCKRKVRSPYLLMV